MNVDEGCTLKMNLSPDLLFAAVEQTLTRGVVAKREVAQVQRALQDAAAK